MGVLKLLKMKLLSLFPSWQVHYWYIRILILCVDFCVLLLGWKFSESADIDNFPSTFVIGTLFISFSCLTALAKDSRTMVNKSGEKGQSSLGPDLRGDLFLLCNITLALSLSYTASIKLTYAPSISGFFGAFHHDGMLEFVKGFFCIC